MQALSGSTCATGTTPMYTTQSGNSASASGQTPAAPTGSEVCTLSPEAEEELNVTSPGNEQTALQNLQAGNAPISTGNQQQDSSNYNNALQTYLNPPADAATPYQNLSKQLHNMQNFWTQNAANAGVTPEAGLQAQLAGNKFGDLTQAMAGKGYPIAGPMANLHNLAGAATAWGAGASQQ